MRIIIFTKMLFGFRGLSVSHSKKLARGTEEITFAAFYSLGINRE